jgi:molybdopterin/thiamine biosynthesis adenylyltransferase
MTPERRERYSRQIRFAPLGEQGQERLLGAHVAIVGCGALGSFQAGALARAGVGALTLIDRDYVEISNLQRQWLFDEADAEQAVPKAVASARQLARINSECKTTPVVSDLTADNIHEVLEGADLILDGTDNFETRFLVNDYSILYGTPWIYGAAVGSYGLSMPVLPERSACLACVYPEAPGGVQPTCETAGVLNSITSIIASLQCAMATKILSGTEVARQITTVDVWTGAIRQISMPDRNPECRACGHKDFKYLDTRQRAPVSLCGRNAVQIHERRRPLDLDALTKQLAPLAPVRGNEFALRFFPDPYEMTIFPDGRAIIKGTIDIGVARGLYAKYVGA